jgi:hypothetical protein
MLIKIFLKASQLNEKHLLLVQEMPTCVPGNTGFHMHFRRRSFKFKTIGASFRDSIVELILDPGCDSDFSECDQFDSDVFCRDMLDTDLHDDEARPIT